MTAGSPRGGRFTVALFVPADRPERYAKACASGADAIIVDLEDAVAPHRRGQARSDLRSALAAGLDAIVRINALSTVDGADDLVALKGMRPRAIMVAKAAAAKDFARVRAVAGDDVPLIALIESIAGIERLSDIAAAPGVQSLAFGAYDLCAELGARPTVEVLAAWRSRIVFAARAAGRWAIDSPYLVLDDDAGLRADARRAVDFGFDGKLAVHPKQVASIAAEFTPLPHDVQRAREIVEAFSMGGVGAFNGAMVDRPVVLAALRTLERVRPNSAFGD